MGNIVVQADSNEVISFKSIPDLEGHRSQYGTVIASCGGKIYIGTNRGTIYYLTKENKLQGLG
jgi:hypothetical protein